MIGRIKLVLSNYYGFFKKSNLYKLSKKLKILKKTKYIVAKSYGTVFPCQYKLHGDPILKAVFEIIGRELKVTSIIETGTYVGLSTSLMATMFPGIKIYTCEINELNYQRARKNLKKFLNVNLYREISPKFLKWLIDSQQIGNRPFFFLDAHWLDEWPLEEEIKIISNNLISAVIIIDDFKIPGDDRFKYDKYGTKECSIDLIIPKLNKKNNYNILFPHYGREIFNDKIYHPQLSGYAIIFQNCEHDFKRIYKLHFIKKYFVNGNNHLKNLLHS